MQRQGKHKYYSDFPPQELIGESEPNSRRNVPDHDTYNHRRNGNRGNGGERTQNRRFWKNYRPWYDDWGEYEYQRNRFRERYNYKDDWYGPAKYGYRMAHH